MSEEKREKPHAAGTALDDHEEHSGLHDIKALAERTKSRITRRQSTQSEVDESLLASASVSALRAVALPAAGKEVAPPSRSARGSGLHESVTATEAAPGVASATPASAKGSSKWIFAVGAIAAVAAGAFFYMKKTSTGSETASARPAAGEVVAINQAPRGAAGASVESMTPPAAAGTASEAPDEAPVPTAPSDEAPPADPVASDDTTLVAEGKPADKTVAVADRKPSRGDDHAASASKSSKSSGGSSDKPPETTAGSDSKAAATGSSKASGATVAPTPPAGGDKSLDDLLAQASGGAQDASKPKDSAADKEPSKKSLDRSDLQKAMGAIKGKIRGCYDTHQERGTVMVKFVVTPDGAVTGATATGKFAGTPSGDCVVSAVSGAKLPAFSGSQMSFTYPFLLSD